MNMGDKYTNICIGKCLNKINDKRAWIKEGYIGMFVFFPTILQDKFQVYLKVVLDKLQERLSDNEESIRKLALRVLGILIKRFAKTNIEMLLQPVKEGLFAESINKR